MPRVARELSALAVKRATAPGMHFVGGAPGLALHVTNSGARSWLLRAMVAGQRREMGLGPYPAVSLADARERANTARSAIANGADPVADRRAARSALRASTAAALTFEQCAQRYIAAHESSWKNAKHAQQWRNTLATYAYPTLGKLLVRDVAKHHVLAVLEPIWNEKNETATRVRSRIELVLSYAMQAGYRPEELNPARWRGGLDTLLAPPNKVAPVEHHAALAFDDAPAFMARLRTVGGAGARALDFAILTAARSGEVRGATWAEIDTDAALWTIPAKRMKAGREHRIPLSRDAVALLAALPRNDDAGLVFPAVRGGMLSDATLAAVLRRMQVPVTVHGFRSTFRDWVAERTSYPNELAEMALAHTIGDKAEAAYRRGDMLQRRAAMMNDWAAFIAKPETKARRRKT